MTEGTLITFLGRAAKGEQGYREVSYRFPDGTIGEPTGVLGWDLCERLKPDHLVVLGTTGSMWDYLVESVHPESSDHEDLRLELQTAVIEGRVDQPMLDEVAPLVAGQLGIEVALRVIPYGVDEAEQVEVLEVIADAVAADTVVSLDITHGFRHLPMLGLVSALHLEAVKGVRIESIWYGFFDPDKAEASVYDLAGLLHIVEWVKALAEFGKDGDYAVFSSLLETGGLEPAACKLLGDAAFLERTSRAGGARGKLRKFRESLQRHPLKGAAALFSTQLLERTEWVEHDRLYERQRALGVGYLEQGDYLRACVYIFEAFVTRLVNQYGGNCDRYRDRDQAREKFEERGPWREKRDYVALRDLRNALAHGTASNKGDVTSVLDSPERLHQRLRELIDALLPEGSAERDLH